MWQTSRAHTHVLGTHGISKTLSGYIRRFSRQGNELPDIADADVIGALLSKTTYESLVHKIGYKGPQTTKDLLDIATSHASGEEAVGAIFDRPKGKAKWDEDADEGAFNRPQQEEGQAAARWLARGHCRPQGGSEDLLGYPRPLREAARRAMPEPCFPHQAPI